jgi:predicted NBD/HSP70 family sugar kinase
VRENLFSGMKADPRIVRQINRESVFNALRTGGEVTIAEIASRTKLSISAVTLVLGDLERMGLVASAGEAHSTGGRRPTLYAIDRSSRFVVGVDVGTQSVKAGRVALDGRISDVRTRSLTENEPARVAAAVKEVVAELAAAAGAGAAGILGVGLSQAGIVDGDGQRVVFDVHRGWRDVQFGLMLRELLGIPVVIVEDARARILAEMESGAGQREDHVLYVLIGPAHGKGISAGFESNGTLLEGAQGFAGEVGHMVLDPSGPVCSCGRRGCWEALTEAIVGHGEARSLQDALAGADALDRFTEVHAEGIANLVHAFNPRLVVIGGNAATLGEPFRSRLVSRLEARIMAPFRERLEVKLSSIEEDSPIRGAGVAILRRVLGVRGTHAP